MLFSPPLLGICEYFPDFLEGKKAQSRFTVFSEGTSPKTLIHLRGHRELTQCFPLYICFLGWPQIWNIIMVLSCLILDKSEKAWYTFLGLMSNYGVGDDQLLYKVLGSWHSGFSVMNIPHEFNYHHFGAWQICFTCKPCLYVPIGPEGVCLCVL